MHLLIADDLRDNAESLAAVLKGESGVDTVDVAYDGLQAVKLAQAHLPDLAFLDIEMPILSGADAARAIQAVGEQGGPMLVAMTGNSDSAIAAQNAGVFACVLVKPLQYGELLRILHAAAARREASGAAIDGRATRR